MDKKVLYIGGFELPDKNAAAHRVIGVSNVLKLLGYTVTLLGVTKNKHDSNIFEFKYINELFKYNEIDYPNSFYSWIKYLGGSKHIFKVIENEKPDIIILYNYPALAMFRILKYCKRKNIKVIADTTEWYEGLGNLVKKNIKKIDVYFRMKVLNHSCDGQIVISQYLFDYYKDNRKAIVEIPPLFDVENEKFYNDLSSYKLEEGFINLIYSGSPGAGNKDRLDLIIKSVVKYPKIRLKIIGITEQQYKSIFKDNSISNNVIFLGRIEHVKALELIKESDFTIFLREKNLPNTAGFPTKFAESISVGTPVLTNSSSNLYDYFKLNIGIEIENMNPEAIDKVLEEILKLTKLELKNRKEECLNFKLFDFRNYTNSIENFFNLINKQ
ncbi:glycosyltransferase [Myroides marinus]|uniref:glycosyltransferase n=1 Tax=Myroides marinus TaxID=703342 RepID=UPI002575A511|nr:glycosyltransferase [Myroides marinus]MDM1376763.1 glycosyltransferase [Myroides marinus]